MNYSSGIDHIKYYFLSMKSFIDPVWVLYHQNLQQKKEKIGPVITFVFNITSIHTRLNVRAFCHYNGIEK